MYAIIESGGRQFKIHPERRVRVPRLTGDVGAPVVFDRVLYAAPGPDDDPLVGTPFLEGARVLGEITGHGRAAKIVVFKFKRRHRYRRKLGHRQDYTEVVITGLELGRPASRESVGRRQPVSRGRAADERESSPAEARQDSTQRAVRPVGPHLCGECGRGFASERGLQQHRAKAHPD